MPRPNPPRPLRGEVNLARRIAYERERAGWSTEGLARRMTDHGCPINQSAIWKIENGDPPRRITYDEAVAFAEVFDIPLEELSVPPEIVADRTALQLLDEYRRARQEAIDAFYRLTDHMSAHPRVREVIEENWVRGDLSKDVLEDIFDKLRRKLGPLLHRPVGELWGQLEETKTAVQVATEGASKKRHR
jgi:transcriptional regulator with XRE-family HTH domain